MIYLFDGMDEISDNTFAIAFSMMYPDRRKRTSRYHFKKDRLLSTLSYSLLLYALEQEGVLMSVPPRFSCGKYGKPYFDGEAYSGLFFNFSHCDKGIVCGISSSEIGVDIEGYVDDYEKISHLVLHPNERELLENCENPVELFTRIWTVKEAYTKMKGCGLSEEITELDFSALMSQNDYDGAMLYSELYPEYAVSVFCDGVRFNSIISVTAHELTNCISALYNEKSITPISL